MNGTYREFAERARMFERQTGEKLSAFWTTPERFQLLPQEVRARRPVIIEGVPVNVIAIV